ncbi:MAG: glucose-6-phosphate isomerase [Gammaproteobacteria bacterium]|nr:glucose-6-phosphate isomerase [Gammaproteobacteria bacterium]
MRASPPHELAAWRRLAKLAEPRTGSRPSHVPNSLRLGPLLVDYSKQGIDKPVAGALADLAAQSGLESAIAALFSGDPVNRTEDRAALHTSLRAHDCPDEVRRERDRFLDVAERVRSGEYRGYTAKAIDTVVAIGIGGSQLGPELVVDALARSSGTAPEIRFLANVDGTAATSALAGLDPATTLVILISKSFTTLEMRVNAAAARSWFLERTCEANALARHFLAVTANEDAAAEFGVAGEHRFRMWDWVGGRFSLWSAAGLPIAIALGRDGFESLLAGARQVDDHFRSTPFERNIPVLLALLQVWNTNFHGAASHALLVYDNRLKLLPDHLQQLEMESNGKSVRNDGQPTETHTAPIVWGGEETNGQHAFHQLLHQGTRAFSADLIACVDPGHDLEAHHDWLLANCLAQSEAMLLGREGEATAPHRRVKGGNPTTTILLDELDARSLGALLALYEHKVFCLGTLWQINPFDQWGVELGKELAGPIHGELIEGSQRGGNPATAELIEAIKRARNARP